MQTASPALVLKLELKMTEHSLPSPIVEVPESVADLPTSLEELALPSLFLFPTTHHQTSESRRGSQTQR